MTKPPTYCQFCNRRADMGSILYQSRYAHVACAEEDMFEYYIPERWYQLPTEWRMRFLQDAKAPSIGYVSACREMDAALREHLL